MRTSSRSFFLAALIGAVAMGACSLNTQPIPPGETAGADGGSYDGQGGTGLSSDASASLDSGVTSNPSPGDAGDGSIDASDEDASDAASDADTDAGDE